VLCVHYYVNGETQLSIRLNAGTTSGDGVVLIHIRSVFSITVRQNTSTLFYLLFRPNRIGIEYSVQP